MNYEEEKNNDEKHRMASAMLNYVLHAVPAHAP